MNKPFDNQAYGRKRRVMPSPWNSRAAAAAEPEVHEPHDELFVEAFARGIAVIRSFANRQHPLTIAEVSRRAGVSRSAARRLLHTLVTLGYACFNEQGFTLLPKTLMLGSAFLTSDALVEIGQPIVNRLAAITGNFCSLNVPQGYEALMVCLSYLNQPAEVDAPDPNVGMSAPMYCSASGLVFLSTYSEPQLNDYLDHVKLHSYTHLTSTDPAQLRERLQTVRERGYAVIDRELSNSLRSISVPVQDRAGRMVAALVSMATPQQASLSELQSRLPLLNTAAQELGRQL